MLLVAKRYGSIYDFSNVQASYSAVARAAKVAYSTARNVLVRFVSNGFKWMPFQRRRAYRTKLPPELQERLC